MILKMFKKKPIENVIFLHLPKAGGTTLRHIFYEQYSYLKSSEIYTINRTKETAAFLKLSQKQRNNIKLLIGHFSYGLHKILNNRKSFTYITFMRNPVERAISAFYYNKEKENSDVYKLINDENLSLKQYLEKDIEPWSNNAMTKHLYGATLEEFLEPCTEKMFKLAKENLQNSFTVVGLTERFDESLLLLQKEFNWNLPFYERKNITKSEQVYTDEDVEIVKKHNTYDIELYALGKELFQKKWNNLEDKEEKLINFKTNNS